MAYGQIYNVLTRIYFLKRNKNHGGPWLYCLKKKNTGKNVHDKIKIQYEMMVRPTLLSQFDSMTKNPKNEEILSRCSRSSWRQFYDMVEPSWL